MKYPTKLEPGNDFSVHSNEQCSICMEGAVSLLDLDAKSIPSMQTCKNPAGIGPLMNSIFRNKIMIFSGKKSLFARMCVFLSALMIMSLSAAHSSSGQTSSSSATPTEAYEYGAAVIAGLSGINAAYIQLGNLPPINNSDFGAYYEASVEMNNKLQLAINQIQPFEDSKNDNVSTSADAMVHGYSQLLKVYTFQATFWQNVNSNPAYLTPDKVQNFISILNTLKLGWQLLLKDSFTVPVAFSSLKSASPGDSLGLLNLAPGENMNMRILLMNDFGPQVNQTQEGWGGRNLVPAQLIWYSLTEDALPK